MTIIRHAITAVIMVTFGSGIVWALTMPTSTPELAPWSTDVTSVAADPVCTEDMDCWDCETMGNRICGPLTLNDTTREDNDR